MRMTTIAVAILTGIATTGPSHVQAHVPAHCEKEVEKMTTMMLMAAMAMNKQTEKAKAFATNTRDQAMLAEWAEALGDYQRQVNDWSKQVGAMTTCIIGGQ